MRCRRVVTVLVLPVFLGVVSPVVHSTAPATDKVGVFVSVPPQAYLVERIGGGNVKVDVLVQPGQEPHTFEPTPRQVTALSKAALFFAVGMPYEKNLIAKVHAGHESLNVVDTVGSSGDETEPAHHGENPYGGKSQDPHVWLSPARIRVQAESIAKALAETDPAHAEEYEANLAKFLKDLNATDQRVCSILKPFQGRSFYVFHPAFGHFAEAYGLRQEAVEVEGKEPSPKQLRDLIRKARSEKARVIFVQPEFSDKTARAVAEAIGGAVVPLDPLAEDVLKNLEDIARKLESALTT